MMKLTAKEEEVMEKVWMLDECTPKQVQALYDEPRPLINSVSNAMQSLERKGYLTHRQQGRGYVYMPAVAQKDYGKSKLGTFVEKYFDSSYMSVVSEFVHEEKVSKAELVAFLHELMKEE